MLCALLLLPGVLGTALAGPISGPEECAKGSAVWCRDLQAAMTCGAVGHCRSTVWSQPTAKTLPCSVCLDVTAAASNGLNPEATEADVLALVKKACEWLPGQGSWARCQGMAEAHGSAILSMLGGAPGSTPAQVCVALTLCQPLQRNLAVPGPVSGEDTSEREAPFMTSGALSFHPARTAASAVCQDCVRLVTQLQGAVGPNLSSLAEVTTQEQCKSLEPSLPPLCKNYIHQFFARIEQTLRFVPPNEVCEKGGFCEEPEGRVRLAHVASVDEVPSLELASPRQESELQMKAGVVCDTCLQVVQKLDRWLGSNSTKAIISRALDRLCSVLPAPLVQECVNLVDTYSPSLLELLTRITPKKLCAALRLCSRRRLAREVGEPPATPLPPLLDEEGHGSLCNGCQRLLDVSARNLEQSSTRRGILKAFKSGCGILPLTYMIQCNRFVTEYQPAFIETLRDVMDPAFLCTKMGACHTPRTAPLGTDQCVLGPRFWCESQEAAEMCNALEHCQRRVWKESPFHTRERA
uniref:Prosaposin like 1 n=1 Tax=Catagonus wagneri TaxID=51154 RepID=A0A8C3YKK5_9CETA